jgi:hypothetical protein
MISDADLMVKILKGKVERLAPPHVVEIGTTFAFAGVLWQVLRLVEGSEHTYWCESMTYDDWRAQRRESPVPPHIVRRVTSG